MSNQTPKNQQSGMGPKNIILLITAGVLALALTAVAVLTVVKTFRRDNPSDTTNSSGTTAPVIDAEAEGKKLKNTVAITVGDHSLNAVELNYYYIEIVNNFVNEYSYYIYYFNMIDTTKPLNQQYYDEEAGITWADYFLDVTEESIKSTYLLCDLAQENGFTLSEDEQAYLENIRKTIEYYATYYQYPDVNSYMVDFFGYGADIDSYMAYCERSMLADAYYSHYADSLKYTDAQLREFEADNQSKYNSYSYATYYLSNDKFLTGGTEGEDGKITYTDEQKAAAAAAAEATAMALKGGNCESLDAFNAMILGLEVNASLTSISIGENKDCLYATIDTSLQEWIASADRVYGDVTVIPKTSTNADKKEVVDGYYIVWFGGVNRNEFALKDVRHLLVLFKDANGKTYTDGVTSFTDEQKAAAKAEAEKLLAEWMAGEMTEDSFVNLVIKKSEDGGSAANGGLYENIYPGQMVKNFQDWCYDETRTFGDTGIVESVYGYHIMFFVGDSDITYRDYMVSYDLRSKDLNEWHTALLESVELKEVCLDYCDLDMKIGG